MIIQTAIPLLVEIGPAVTTLQIARAAGISEPTLFRVFEDKNDLLGACMTEVTDPGHTVDELAAIEPDLPLTERVVALIEVLRAQGERTGAVIGAVSLAAAGRPRRHEDFATADRERLSAGRAESYARLHDGIVAVLESDAAGLRTSPTEAASLVLAIVLALGRGGGWNTGEAGVTTAGLADLILHGIAG
jgi:AcrR family transcriptional regulator